MKIIGLTGPTGAGKSTVSDRLREMGYYIADADAAARECVQPGSVLLAELAEAFGADILEDGVLNRRELARRAFVSPENTARLNALMHPAIEKILFDEIAAHPDCRGAVVDAAALIESGIDKKCDFVAVVMAPKDVRLRRIMARDGISEADALLRMNAQKDDAFYLDAADVVIQNYAPFDMEDQLRKITERADA